jgi:hypothetical protein
VEAFIQNKVGVPNAPLSKTWHEFVLKRMLRYAAENGYDKVAWTTGEQQAERYNLSKTIDRINYEKTLTGERYYITAYDKRGSNVFSKSLMTEQEVEDTIGKELTKKIVQSENYKGTLSGVDLEIGGSGMKGFYDKMIPDFLSKYVKKWGGKVEQVDLNIGTKKSDKWEVFDTTNGKVYGTFDTETEAQEYINKSDNEYLDAAQETAITQPSVTITPAMKEALLYEGQPLYSSRTVTKRDQSQLIDVAASAKDISGVKAYGTDIYRIFRDVFKSNTQWAKETYLDKLDTAKIRWVETQEKYITELKDNVTNKGIGQNSKLSKLIQLYGEKKIDEAELKRRSPKRYQDVIDATNWFRKVYKELLTEINRVRTEIYPNNPDKIIPERKDYFRHFTEIAEGIQGLKNSFDTPANIDPQLVGTSEYTKPRAKWESIFQERKGDKTKIDAVGGFLDYLPAAAYAINIDPMISMFEKLEQDLKDATVESKHLNNFIQFLDDYAKDLAGKTNPMGDRALQKLIGRTGMRVLNWMNGRIKGNLVMATYHL